MSVLVIRLGAVLKENQPVLIRHFPGFLAQRFANDIPTLRRWQSSRSPA